ncbi:MAG: hypothetical protein ACI8UO_004504, partial [Verrucomicrobiales bacterium]
MRLTAIFPFFALFLGSVGAQDLIDAPHQLPVFSDQESQGRAELDFEFYPLGWSESGEQLASLVAVPNEAEDERRWEVRIVDLVTDETLLAETVRHPSDGNVRTFWAKHGDFVKEQMEARGIERRAFELSRFPAMLGTHGADVYEFVLARQYGAEPNFGYQGLNQLTVTLIRNGVKSKRILEETWDQWFPLAAGVVGYLPSPTGDRIAILL